MHPLPNPPPGSSFVNIFEPNGVTLSDQLQLTNNMSGGGAQPSWSFFSNPAAFPSMGTLLASIIETGNNQVAYVYTSDGDAGETVTINIRSAVPEPASLLLFALGLAGLGFIRRKRA
jgi:hypothetical protein